MSENVFLLCSFIGAIIVVFFASRNFLSDVLSSRKLEIINKTVSLKKDLKFAELDKKKAHQEYSKAQEKNRDWMKEARIAYTSCYEHHCRIHKDFLNEEKDRLNSMKNAKKKEERVKLLGVVIDAIKEEITIKNFQLNLDLEGLLKKI